MRLGESHAFRGNWKKTSQTTQVNSDAEAFPRSQMTRYLVIESTAFFMDFSA